MYIMKINDLGLKISREWILIIFFVLLKLLIHSLTYANYELHRDAYLYYAQSEHLAWQYDNNWPVLRHMEELHRTQLVHI